MRGATALLGTGRRTRRGQEGAGGGGHCRLADFIKRGEGGDSAFELFVGVGVEIDEELAFLADLGKSPAAAAKMGMAYDNARLTGKSEDFLKGASVHRSCLLPMRRAWQPLKNSARAGLRRPWIADKPVCNPLFGNSSSVSEKNRVDCGARHRV